MVPKILLKTASDYCVNMYLILTIISNIGGAVALPTENLGYRKDEIDNYLNKFGTQCAIWQGINPLKKA